MERVASRGLLAVTVLFISFAGFAVGPEIENPTHRYVVWGDYRIEVNQYGGLGRDWPHPVVWEQYELLKMRAAEEEIEPNTIGAILLVCPTTEAAAHEKDEDGNETEIGRKTTSMSSAEVKWALEQWREFAEMVYVYSRGEAWLRTDVKVIDAPLQVHANKDYGFWPGPQHDLLDRYVPFDRGDYDSYNSIYNSKDLRAGPWGGTYGADLGPKGCGSSDNAWLSRGPKTDERHGFVFWHEWLNQMCWATANVMPYPEGLWSLYVFDRNGYRPDPINAWPWITSHRDMMRFAIRPGMWDRWSVIDPYISEPIGDWIRFGPVAEDTDIRAFLIPSASGGETERREIDAHGQFRLPTAVAEGEPPPGSGVYVFRTYAVSDRAQEVRLWAGADERFQLWLNGVMIRDGTGTLKCSDGETLVEKVTYTELKAGANTLALVLPNTDDQVRFRVRVCRAEGSGRLPEGIAVAAVPLDGAIPLPLEEEAAEDFAAPTLYRWADVGDDPWLLLPRLDEDALRALTGIMELSLHTEGKVVTTDEGKERVPRQHLLLDVPEGSVESPWSGGTTEDAVSLDNDLDYNWESVAWLRLRDRPGPGNDVVLLRFDVAEPLMHLLPTQRRPAHESIVGYLLEDSKLAYVLLCDLDIGEAPAKEIDLFPADVIATIPPQE